MQKSIEINTKGLDALIKALGKPPSVRVGIMGEKASAIHEVEPGAPQPKKPLTNAQVGAFHELALDESRQRSFLRVPIMEHIDTELKKAGLLGRENIKNLIATKSLFQIMELVGFVAEGIVMEAFSTGGFGKWKPSIMKYKKNKQTLLETTQLAQSVTSQVQE